MPTNNYQFGRGVVQPVINSNRPNLVRFGNFSDGINHTNYANSNAQNVDLQVPPFFDLRVPTQNGNKFSVRNSAGNCFSPAINSQYHGVNIPWCDADANHNKGNFLVFQFGAVDKLIWAEKVPVRSHENYTLSFRIRNLASLTMTEVPRINVRINTSDIITSSTPGTPPLNVPDIFWNVFSCPWISDNNTSATITIEAVSTQNLGNMTNYFPVGIALDDIIFCQQ